MALLFNPDLKFVNLEAKACSGNIPLAGCSLSYQVRHLSQFGFNLVLYTTGNAVFAHERILRHLARAQIHGPLDEFECYSNILITSQCVSGRQLRRWFHEDVAPWDALAEVWHHLKALEAHFGLPPMP